MSMKNSPIRLAVKNTGGTTLKQASVSDKAPAGITIRERSAGTAS